LKRPTALPRLRRSYYCEGSVYEKNLAGVFQLQLIIDHQSPITGWQGLFTAAGLDEGAALGEASGLDAADRAA
jgi:hypothetical protein